MAQSNPELWEKLAKFEVSPPGNLFSFVGRLARENDWPVAIARLAFEEYRRFLYLSVVTPQPLTASDAIERVWRLHLEYPTHYRQSLCREVLGRRLRHPPSDGAGREAGYGATLAAYEAEFGNAPPGEIWRRAEPRASLALAPVDARAPQPGRAARGLAQLPALPVMAAAAHRA
jgi:hypothetical protein